jgi:hypothetical protein
VGDEEVELNIIRDETSEGDTRLEVKFETTYREVKVILVSLTSLITAGAVALRQQLHF